MKFHRIGLVAAAALLATAVQAQDTKDSLAAMQQMKVARPT